MQVKNKEIKTSHVNARILSCIYVVYWLFFSLHHFFAPQHTHEKKVCHHSPNEKHIHSEEYAGHDCSICQIAPTLAELQPLKILALVHPTLVPTDNNFGEITCLSVSPPTLSQPRAPPVRLT